MRDHHPQPVENYTNPALVMGLVNLLWIFVAIWIAFGFVFVLLLGATLNHLITRLAAYKAARA